MKNKISLKTLVVVSFLIFTLPFLRTCSNSSIESLVKIEHNEAASQIEVKTTNNEDARQQYEKNRDEVKSENTITFYQLIGITLEITKEDFVDNKIFTDKTSYPTLGFLLLFVISILLLFFTLINKFKVSSIIATANILVFIISTFALFITEIVENIEQFRIGYYLFFLNSILILILLRRNKITS